jgi:ATP-dependent Lhr-like helicase
VPPDPNSPDGEHDTVAAGDGTAGDTDAAGRGPDDPGPSRADHEVPGDATVSSLHQALRRHLAQRGASFWPELVAAASEAGEPYDDDSVLAALWDLVWAGEVTNDSLAPLRALVSGRPRRSGGARAGRPLRPGARRPNLGRPNLGRPNLRGLSALGPPAGAGRWSLVAPLLRPTPTPTEAAHAQALQLLERHGVLTREAALSEGIDGGFAAIYPVLKALEERGQVRRGYFVAGLGAAQFALPGAVDRLRSVREPLEPDLTPVVLAATDPAQPYGAALPWPDSDGRPSRRAGAFVVLVGGEPVAELERGAKSLTTFGAALQHPHWAEGLTSLVKDGRLRKLEIAKIDGAPAAESPVADHLRQAGFTDAYKGLLFRI